MPELTIIDLPSFKPDAKRHGGREGSDTMVAIDFSRKIVLICGSSYAGEMKKSVFTTLNFYLPAQGRDADALLGQCRTRTAIPRCSSVSPAPARPRSPPIPNRTLIGDDETGWGPDGIFNFEGGCYAKTIKLSREAEPQIWDATNRFGAILENVAFDPITRVPDYDDQSKTENTRSAYPLDFIPNASRTGCAGHPKNVIFLTADAFGVMPPIAKLTPAQAMYHFLSGYTAKVAGTEKGLVGVQPEFSTCFGAPFLPRPPAEYGDLFRKYITEHEVDCWLVNSGWTGGHIWRRPPHADQGDARAGHRRAQRIAEERLVPHRSVFRFLGADLGAGRRAASALSDEDLEGQSRVRRHRAQAREDVPGQLRQVREGRLVRRARRGAGSAARGGISL